MNYTVHGILQARLLAWVAFPFSRETFQPRDQTQISCIAGRFFTVWAIRKAGVGPPRILEWVAYPFSVGTSRSRNWARVSCIAGGFFISWATREALFLYLFKNSKISALRQWCPHQEASFSLAAFPSLVPFLCPICPCNWVNFFKKILSFFFAVPHSMWDLKSPTRDRAHAPCSGRVGKSLQNILWLDTSSQIRRREMNKTT